jgi:L-lactate dehydrogenase (cytochrome)
VPLILKGVQCWEVRQVFRSLPPSAIVTIVILFMQDALEAYDQNVAGIVLSNHGGRQLDFARSGIEVLVEVVTKLKEKRGLMFPNERFQLFVDGGVRRATDVLKAVALGATAGELPWDIHPASSRTFCYSLFSSEHSWYRETIPVCILCVRYRGRG